MQYICNERSAHIILIFSALYLAPITWNITANFLRAFTYRGIILDAVWEVGGRRELSLKYDGTAEDEGLAHRDTAAGRVVQRHGAVDDVTGSQAAEVVDA